MSSMVVIGLAFASSTVTMAQHQDPPTGFAHWAWGTTLTEILKDRNCKSYGEELVRKLGMALVVGCSGPYSLEVAPTTRRSASLKFTKEDQLSAYEYPVPRAYYHTLRAAAIQKWGPPSTNTLVKYSNRLGAVFEGERLFWTWPGGADTTILLQEIDSDPDTSSLFVSSSLWRTDSARQQEQNAERAAETLK